MINEIIEDLYVGDQNDVIMRTCNAMVTFDLRGWKVDLDGVKAEDVFFLGHLGEAIDDIRLSLSSPVLLHCHAGIDRAPFAAACYLVTEHGFDPTDAYEFVKKRRPQTIIHDDWMKTFYDCWVEMNE